MILLPKILASDWLQANQFLPNVSIAKRLNFNRIDRIWAMEWDKTFRFAVSDEQKASYEEAAVNKNNKIDQTLSPHVLGVG